MRTSDADRGRGVPRGARSEGPPGGPKRAVYAYSPTNYPFWEERLGRGVLEPGSFGENFTVEGLTDTEVNVEDRFRVGSALVEVSQPRNPCFKLGLRLADPQMPSLLAAESRPGFYLRVLEEGEVGPGDALELVHHDPEPLTAPTPGQALLCCSSPRTDLVLDL